MRRALFALVLALGACMPWVDWEPAEVPSIAPAPLAGREAGQTDLADFDDVDGPVAVDPVIGKLRREGRAVEAISTSLWVKRWARGVDELTPVTPFSVHDPRKNEARQVDTELFYYTKYGSPLAYARALDLAAAAGLTVPTSVIDFGYGTIGHLRLLATLGARTIGIDVDPMLRDMYAAGHGSFSRGSVTLLHGAFPGELANAVGSGHDLFISKNVLKNGYIHPAQEVPERQTISLGVSDEQFVAAIGAALRPGGFVMIYNVTPPPNRDGLPYRTWADGRCPFAEGLWDRAGFDVVAFDVDDSAAMRRLGRTLGWDADVDLEANIFAMYTLAKKR